MQILGMGSLPISGALASMISGGDDERPGRFSPKEYVAWTNLKFIGDSNRAHRGMLAVNNNAVALVSSRQLSYKAALSYENCTSGSHSIIFKGCDQTPDGVVFITVSSVDNLALIMASENLPDQVVIASSFSFDPDKIPALEKELNHCGYSLLGDDNTFRRGGHNWTHAIVDNETSVIIGYVARGSEGLGDDFDDDIPGSLSELMRRASRKARRSEPVSLNITTTDTVLINALIDFHEKVNELEVTAIDDD